MDRKGFGRLEIILAVIVLVLLAIVASKMRGWLCGAEAQLPGYARFVSNVMC